MRRRAAALFCLLAGGGDAATGVLLLASPALAARLLGAREPAGDGIAFLRFVGVFVACVGCAYLVPWLSREAARRRLRLAAAVEMTAVVRLAVALFLALSERAGELGGPWLAVGAYDALLATAQLALLSRGVFDAV